MYGYYAVELNSKGKEECGVLWDEIHTDQKCKVGDMITAFNKWYLIKMVMKD